MTYRILICEPDAAQGRALSPELCATACEVVCCASGAEAIALLGRERFDVAVISLASDGTGRVLLDRLSGAASTIPFLVATTAEDIEARIFGLDRGAVDYLVKPFRANELMTRVATVLKRREGARGRFLRRGDIVLDKETGRIGDGVTWTALSPTERKVVPMLFEDANRPVSKQRLRNALNDGRRVSDNAIEVVIHRLRIKARSWGMHIQTYRGLGYVLEEG